MIALEHSKLGPILEGFKDRPILVVGDLILDKFIWGDVNRISPEAPVPVIDINRQSYRLGGAANVAVNLAVMGARPCLVGVIGNDPEGESVLDHLKESGIATDCIIVDVQRPTSVKTRIFAQHQQVCRTDRESRKPLSREKQAELLQVFRRQLPASHAVILSDYAKGVLGTELTPQLVAEAREAGKFIAIDPKVSHFSAYHEASVVTPNKKEAEAASGMTITDGQTLTRTGRHLLKQLNSGHLLVTRGDEGMTLFDHEREYDIPTTAREVFDVTGAGDTVIATLSLAVASGASVYEAALIANLAAGVVVGKLGTATATVEEILDQSSSK